jgi:hydroxymethylpyrimidine pyrophosphatase-like HAD family hydrolase
MSKNEVQAIIFLDADGTLLGKGGSLIHDEKGVLSNHCLRLFKLFQEFKVKPVLVSSRSRSQLFELSRLLGGLDFIAEMGYVIGFESGNNLKIPFKLKKHENPKWLYQKGSLDKLFRDFEGYLELHSPWWKNLKVSLLLRGCVYWRKESLLLQQLNESLSNEGLKTLRAVDNGSTYQRAGLECSEVRIYHILNVKVSKLEGVKYYFKKIWPHDSKPSILAAGDAASDLELASISDHFFFMGTESDFSLASKLLTAQNFARKLDTKKINCCSNLKELVKIMEKFLKSVLK